MSALRQFLAVYLGSPDSANMALWHALAPEEQARRRQEGEAAWHAWVRRNEAAIVVMGGPLGPTRRISAEGMDDARNAMTAFTIVQAETHEAAAALFENHPHFTLFPG